MKSVLNKDEVITLKKSGQILHQALLKVSSAIKPGVNTEQLDRIAEEFILKNKATPAFKNYFVPGVGFYPTALCVSINNEVVHGIPSSNRILEAGDIVSIDLGVAYRGMWSDSAVTIPVGKISKEAKKLIDTTKECLVFGVEAACVGNRIGAIGAAIQKHAERRNFGIVRELVGHGTGTNLHTEPNIPNYGEKDSGPIIVEGMALAIEPMITAGDDRIKILSDGWTTVTSDGSLAAHFEHTVIIENGKAIVIT